MKTAQEIELRPVIFCEDIGDIIAIEMSVYDAARWQAIDFRSSLREGGQMLVALVDDLVVGYVFWHENDESERSEILNIAVHPMYQRQGFGSLLVDAFKLKKQHKLSVAVRETSLHVQQFLRAIGIECVSVKRRAWQIGDDFEDAFIFEAQ